MLSFKGAHYALLGLGMRLREVDGDATQARTAFEQAVTALEAVVAKGDPNESNRNFHFVMAAASYHLAHLTARAYALLTTIENDGKRPFTPCNSTATVHQSC